MKLTSEKNKLQSILDSLEAKADTIEEKMHAIEDKADDNDRDMTEKEQERYDELERCLEVIRDDIIEGIYSLIDTIEEEFEY